MAQKYEKYDDGSTKWTIVIMDQDGKNEQTIAEAHGTQIEVSPSMNYIAAGNTIINVKTGSTFDISQSGFDFDWSPDEKYLVLINGIPKTLKIYDPFKNELVKDLGYQCGDFLCWKYKDKIAFTMDDEIHYPNTFLCFVNADGTGLVTTNIQMYPEGYDKDKNYLYDWHSGFYRVNLSVTGSAMVAEAVHVYSRDLSVDGYPQAISPDGTKLLLSGQTGLGLSISNVDGTGDYNPVKNK